MGAAERGGGVTKVVVDPLTGEAFALPVRRSSVLTRHELAILRGMADGRTNGDIGQSLGLSEATVRTYVHRAYGRLGARDRAHAVATAFRWGLLR